MLDLISNLEYNNNIYDLSIKQGKTYQLSFNYPQDLSNGEIRGQIRDQYAQDNGNLLAIFSFNKTWDNILGKTNIIATINAADTSIIPYTKYQGTSRPSINNCFVYDIEYEENNVVILLLNGLVEVKPEVTVDGSNN